MGGMVMAFGFLKKKKAVEDLELPAPPKPPELKGLEPEIPPIRAEEPSLDMPDFNFDSEPEEAEELELPEEEPESLLPETEEAEETVEIEHPEPSVIPERLKIPELPKPKVYDKTITEDLPRETVIEKEETKPLFVAVDDYTTVRANTNVIRAKLLEAEEYIQRLSDLKIEEEKSFGKWKKYLEDVEKKLTYVDKVIAKAQG